MASKFSSATIENESNVNSCSTINLIKFDEPAASANTAKASNDQTLTDIAFWPTNCGNEFIEHVQHAHQKQT